jgi:hypothetical protein
MTKKATEFPHGKLHIFGKDIPFKSNGGLNMKYLTMEERKTYKEFLEKKKLKNEKDAMASLSSAFNVEL